MKREHIICERNNLDMKEYQSVRNIREEIHKVRFFFTQLTIPGLISLFYRLETEHAIKTAGKVTSYR